MKKRYNIGIDKQIAIAGKKMAVDLELPFNEYIERLIKVDLKYRLVEQELRNRKAEDNE